MAFLSLTLDNIKTQGATSTQNVDNIKNTDEWTEEKIEEIRKLAINKAIASMSYEGYKILKEANSDLDSWIDSIIKAKLYDMKKYY